MTDAQPDIAVSAASTVQSEQPSLTVSAHSIDESFHQHIAADYWAWRAVFENDRNAKINQHPNFILTELSFSRKAQHRPPTLITCQEQRKTVGAAVLVPKSIGGEKRFGPAWDLKGYRLAGNRLLGNSDVRIQNRLLEGISKHLADTKADFLFAEDVTTDDPLLELAQMSSHDLQVLKPAPFQKRHIIDLPDTHDEYWKRFNSKPAARCGARRNSLANVGWSESANHFRFRNFSSTRNRLLSDPGKATCSDCEFTMTNLNCSSSRFSPRSDRCGRICSGRKTRQSASASALSTTASSITRKSVTTATTRRSHPDRFSSSKCWKTCTTTSVPPCSISAAATRSTNDSLEPASRKVATCGCCVRDCGQE
jgi:hypothetical protein